MGYNIGLNIVEVNGVGSPAIVGAPTSVAAFNIVTQRGVANSAAPVTSFAQFVSAFGGFFPGGLGAYLVKGFFDNGGQTAYINRVISSDPATGDVAASISLTDANAVNTLRLAAGFRGKSDPGAWGNQLYVTVAANAEPQTRLLETAAASLTGTALAAPTDMSSFPALTLAVDGQATPITLSFKASDFPGGADKATPAQIRDAINRQTTQVIATLSGANQLILTSSGAVANLSGGFTSLKLTAANATLGFNPAPAQANGAPGAATATSAQVASLAPFAVGDALRIADGANTALVKLLNIVPATNTLNFSPPIANIAAFNALALRISRVTFNIAVAYGGNDAAHVVERWNALSMEPDAANYAVAVINDPIMGSQYINAADLHSASASGANAPAAVAAFTPLQQGRSGTPTSNDFIGDSSKRTGFFAFDTAQAQLLTCERQDPAIVVAALAYCANRGDCMYVGATPMGYVAAGQAIAYGQAFQGQKVYGALYGPWIYVADPAGAGPNPMKLLPPVGHVLGVYARIATARGVWKAPAGDEANLLGALSVETQLSDADHTALVTQGGVNGVRAAPRAGVIIDASRTLSTDTRWLYVNVRQLFNYVKSSLKSGLSWARQEPNRNTLWDAVRLQTVTPFLMGLWRQGAFGAGSAAQVFTVICDASNNPPDQVDQGNLKVEIYFYPSRPAETIVIVVGQQPSGASAAEA